MTTYLRLRDTGSFAVNILASVQQRLSDQFAKSRADKWKGVLWSRARAGNPVLDGTLTWIDWQAWAEHEAGDHLIVLGRVKETSLSDGPSEEPPPALQGQILPVASAVASSRLFQS